MAGRHFSGDRFRRRGYYNRFGAYGYDNGCFDYPPYYSWNRWDCSW
jgi:hypothetical protein